MNNHEKATLIATEISNQEPFEQSDAVECLASEFLKLKQKNETLKLILKLTSDELESWNLTQGDKDTIAILAKAAEVLNINETTEHKGYLIELCFDSTYDVMKDNELVEHRFKSIEEAKGFINEALR